MMSTLITEVAEKVTTRLDELRPAYLEYLELSAYAEQMSGFEPPEAPQGRIVLASAPEVAAPVAPVAPQAAPAKPAAAKKPAASKKPAARTRPGASKKPAAKAPAANEGETVAKIKEIVAKHPEGIKIGDIIKEGDLSQSYTYDVVKRMTEAKDLERRNRKIFIHKNAKPSAPATSSQTAAEVVTA